MCHSPDRLSDYSQNVHWLKGTAGICPLTLYAGNSPDLDPITNRGFEDKNDLSRDICHPNLHVEHAVAMYV